jgi:outer membrane lipoprotein-sorting protein
MGFCSAAGVPCDRIDLHYQVGDLKFGSNFLEMAAAAGNDPQFKKLVAMMKEARRRLKSGLETVQKIRLNPAKGTFRSIESEMTTFKWQEPDRVYADISDPMSFSGSRFLMGSDGQNCWLYSESDKDGTRLDKTPNRVTRTGTILADPFDLLKGSTDEELGPLLFTGWAKAQLDGRSCYLIEAWDVYESGFVSATRDQWWIDEETLIPKQLIQYSPFFVDILRFEYKDLNQPLPDRVFEPPVAPGAQTHSVFFTHEPQPGEQRFLFISDGSNGRRTAKLGWRRTNGGSTSSGFGAVLKHTPDIY